jgi:hypothetical protein
MRLAGIIMFLIFFGIPVGIFILVLKKVLKDTKKDAWEGEVTDKLYIEKRDDEFRGKINKFYTIVFTTTTGLTRKMAVNPEDFSKWNKGDKVKKEKGKLAPERIT